MIPTSSVIPTTSLLGEALGDYLASCESAAYAAATNEDGYVDYDSYEHDVEHLDYLMDEVERQADIFEVYFAEVHRIV